MLAWLKKIASRVDLYAAHCYGRRQSYLPLGTFFAVDGLVNGGLKTLLRPVLQGTTPALLTFGYYLYSFFDKAKETYKAHPENLNLELEHEKIVDTTEMILSKFKKNKTDARYYLESLGLENNEIEDLLSLSHELDALDLFDLFHKMHSRIHPSRKSYLNSFKAGVLHALTHVNEYLLLRYFADLNLLTFESELTAGNFLGLSILAVGLLSGYQTFNFCNKEEVPSSNEILETIIGNFRFFKREHNQANSFLATLDKSYCLSGEEEEKMKLLASHDATQKCYLGCK